MFQNLTQTHREKVVSKKYKFWKILKKNAFTCLGFCLRKITLEGLRVFHVIERRSSNKVRFKWRSGIKNGLSLKLTL